jgi:hypothetical protein
MKRFLVSLALFILAQLSNATDLRGRVDGTHGYSPVPFAMARVPVTIFAAQPSPYGGANYIPQATTVTGGDGMYYFRGIPPGVFVLQIGGNNYPLQVLPQAAQDIQPVLLRF